MEPDPNFVKMLLNISSKNSDDLIKLCDSSRSLRAYCKKNEQLNERYVNAVAKKNMEKIVSKYVEESDLTKKEQIVKKALVKIKDLISKRIKNPTETSVYDIPPKAIDMIVYALAFYIVLQSLNYAPKEKKTEELIFEDRVVNDKAFTQAIYRFFIQYYKNKYNANMVFEKDTDNDIYA